MKALITGANSGIGLCFSKKLAAMGHSLIIVSNQEKEIIQTANDITSEYKVTCIPLCYDLTLMGACEEIYEWCRENNHKIDILINNAGVFFFNEIKNTSAERVDLMLNLHVLATTKLCQLFSRDMINRRYGYILNMSSLSAWVTYPGISTYSSTKAYILNFSKALWYELSPHNVKITAICPGAVDTGLYGLSKYWRKIAVKIGVSMPPEKLVEKAIKKLFKGKKTYIPGTINKIFAPTLKHLPDCIVKYSAKKISQFMK